jgi:hypothetical protein
MLHSLDNEASIARHSRQSPVQPARKPHRTPVAERRRPPSHPERANIGLARQRLVIGAPSVIVPYRRSARIVPMNISIG